MFIDGFCFGGYRSFGEKQFFYSLSKMNLFIGKNNCGKSNVLRFLIEKLQPALKAEVITESFLDRHQGVYDDGIKASIGLKLDSDVFQKALKVIQSSKYNEQSLYQVFNFLSRITGGEDWKGVWLDFDLKQPSIKIDNEFIHKLFVESKGTVVENHWNALWHGLQTSSGGNLSLWVEKGISLILEFMKEGVFIEIIPAIRDIGLPQSSLQGFGGAGIIGRLAELQNPDYENQHNKKSFNKINKFLQDVISSSDAQLNVNHKKDQLLVEIGDKNLPIQSLGTGVAEVVIMAVACTILENSVVCIEEPEIHLHPHMVRKFLRYLNENTNNQYFITTHSAHVLETSGAKIFHIKNQHGQSIVENVITNKDRAQICFDLGYRASDLIQANCIIWVEGPSDRIYLNHWIHSLAENFIEGTHYSIMFYGGRLLSHLSAEDIEVDEFISLRKLNRNISIMIDSDKSELNADINSTKKRVCEEFDIGSGFAWITEGREIENYIDPTLLDSVVKKLYSDDVEISDNVGSSQYRKPLVYKKGDGKLVSIKKVDVAREIILNDVHWGVLDLKVQMDKILKFIEESNKDE